MPYHLIILNKVTFTLNNLPSTSGIAHCSQPRRQSRGIASDRLARRCVENLQNRKENNDKAALWILATQQMFESNTPSKHLQINTSVAEICDFDDTPVKKSKNECSYTRHPDPDVYYHGGWEQPPKVQPFDSIDEYKNGVRTPKVIKKIKRDHNKEVKRRTGFRSENAMFMPPNQEMQKCRGLPFHLITARTASRGALDSKLAVG